MLCPTFPCHVTLWRDGVSWCSQGRMLLLQRSSPTPSTPGTGTKEGFNASIECSSLVQKFRVTFHPFRNHELPSKTKFWAQGKVILKPNEIPVDIFVSIIKIDVSGPCTQSQSWVSNSNAWAFLAEKRPTKIRRQTPTMQFFWSQWKLENM